MPHQRKEIESLRDRKSKKKEVVTDDMHHVNEVYEVVQKNSKSLIRNLLVRASTKWVSVIGSWKCDL